MNTYMRDEISRFSANGKTFYFNKALAKNGTPYLVVNALYGDQKKERMIVFPSQYLQFHSHLTSAVESLAQISFANGTAGPTRAPVLPRKCPDCGHESGSWEVLQLLEPDWYIQCQCGTIIYHTPGCSVVENDPIV